MTGNFYFKIKLLPKIRKNVLTFYTFETHTCKCMHNPLVGQQSIFYDSVQQLSNISDSYNFVCVLIFIGTMLHATFAITTVHIRLYKYEYIDKHVIVVTVQCRIAFNWRAKRLENIL